MLSQSEKDKVKIVVSKNSFGFAGLWIIAAVSAIAAFVVTWDFSAPIYYPIIFAFIVFIFVVLMLMNQSKTKKALLDRIESGEDIFITEDFQLTTLKGMAAIQYIDENGQQRKASLPTSYSNQYLSKKQFIEKSQLKKAVVINVSSKKSIAVDYESIKD